MDRAHQNGVNLSQALNLFRQNAVVPGDQYRTNQAQIEEARALIDSLEARNQAGYKRYMEQELLQRVQEGEEAKRMLASLGGNGGPPPTSQYRSSSATFPTPPVPAGLQAFDRQDVLPSSARIVEIPAFQRTSPPITSSKGSSSSSAHYSPNVTSSSHTTQHSHIYSSSNTQPFGYEPSPFGSSHTEPQAASQPALRAINPYTSSNASMFSKFSAGTSNYQQTQPQQPSQLQSSSASHYKQPDSRPQSTASSSHISTNETQAVFQQPYSSNQFGQYGTAPSPIGSHSQKTLRTTGQSLQNQNRATYQASAPVTISSSLDGALGQPEHSSSSGNLRTYARKTSPSHAPNTVGDSRSVSRQDLPHVESHVTKEMLLQRAQQFGSAQGMVLDPKLNKEALFKSAAYLQQQYGPDFTRNFLQEALALLNEGQASKLNATADKASVETSWSSASAQATSQASTSAQPIPQTTPQSNSFEAIRTREGTTVNAASSTQQAAPSQSVDPAHTFTNVPISLTSRASQHSAPPSESKPPREAQFQSQAQNKPMNQTPTHVQAQIQAEMQAQAQMQAQLRVQLDAQTRAQSHAQTSTRNQATVFAGTTQPAFVSTPGFTAHNATALPQGYYSRTPVLGSTPVYANLKNPFDQVYWIPTPGPATIPAPPYAPYNVQMRQYQPPVSSPVPNPLAQAINSVKAATQARSQPGPPNANASSSAAVGGPVNVPLPNPIRRDNVNKPRTPAEADKKRLARDILRSLGRSSSTTSQSGRQRATKHAAQSQAIGGSSTTSLSGRQQEMEYPAQPKAIGNTVVSAMDKRPVAAAPEHQDRNINAPSAQTQNLSHVQSNQMHPINAADVPVVPQVSGPSLAPRAPHDGLSSTAPPSQTDLPMETQPPSQELAELTISESQSEDVSVIEDATRMPSPSNKALEEPEILELTTPAAEEYRTTQVASSPVSSTFDLHPQQSESNYVEEGVPLFLPSPSSSPSPPPVGPSHALPGVDDDVMIIDDPQASVKSLVADVEAMNVGDVDAPSELKRGKKRKQMAYVLVPSAPSWVTQAIKKRKKQHASRQMLSDQALNDEDSYAPLEKYVMDQALSKISENPCRWQNCNAILNSGEKLGVHLLLHTKDIDKKSPFLCRWQDCGMKFSSLLKLRTHVEKHPKSSLPCSILGCLQHFTTPIDVMQHEVLHQAPGSDVAIPVKSTTQPYTPRLPSSLGPIPEILPSYRVEPRHVRQAIISAQRHAVLGPWVLRNIFGPVELGMKKPNAAVPLRYYSRPSGVPEDVPQPMQDDYDFLIPLSSGVPKSLVLDDLPSAPISQMIQAGLVFFDTAKITNKTGPVPDAAGGAVTHYTASSNASDAALHHDGQPGSLVVDRQEFSSISVGPVDEVAEADWPKHKNSGEEEAVEKMLL